MKGSAAKVSGPAASHPMKSVSYLSFWEQSAVEASLGTLGASAQRQSSPQLTLSIAPGLLLGLEMRGWELLSPCGSAYSWTLRLLGDHLLMALAPVARLGQVLSL